MPMSCSCNRRSLSQPFHMHDLTMTRDLSSCLESFICKLEVIFALVLKIPTLSITTIFFFLWAMCAEKEEILESCSYYVRPIYTSTFIRSHRGKSFVSFAQSSQAGLGLTRPFRVGSSCCLMSHHKYKKHR